MTNRKTMNIRSDIYQSDMDLSYNVIDTEYRFTYLSVSLNFVVLSTPEPGFRGSHL